MLAIEHSENSKILEQHKPTNRHDTQQIRTLEKKKLLQEKRQERERRKTQEISLLKRSQVENRFTNYLLHWF